ncbi:hypothetical protein ED236_05220 [Pseudomethylobacillus aquaticus]|uniref:Uncharacterized protein n=1 Tax=Pseudomethylobacillus aquaticus TaxID=2676064 RepID=A0A3N0V3G4_9PROT|nr:hypothetical protein [Pseudomethylobacillus aquaticus]ROH87081.1 hypothetical protein ED236_05220 [Pseudomethylobacillus aquaticus]
MHIDFDHQVGSSMMAVRLDQPATVHSAILSIPEHAPIDLEPRVEEGSKLCLRLDHGKLLEVLNISHARVIILVDDHQEHPANTEISTLIISEFNVDLKELFYERVVSTARSIRNPNLLRLCCKRAVKRFHNNYDVAGIAICALGYRVLDANDPQDRDMGWLQTEVNRLLRWRDPVSAYHHTRWATSCLILNAYIDINFDRYEDGIQKLRRLFYYRYGLSYAPLVQTNLVRAGLLIADFDIKMGHLQQVRPLLEEVIRVAEDGVWFSDLDDPGPGVFKFTEFDITLAGARIARGILDKMDSMDSAQLLKTYKVEQLGGYINVLATRGKL